MLYPHCQVVRLHLRIFPPLLRYIRIVHHPLQLRELCLHLLDCALDCDWVEHHSVHLCLVRYKVVLLFLVERQHRDRTKKGKTDIKIGILFHAWAILVPPALLERSVDVLPHSHAHLLV